MNLKEFKQVKSKGGDKKIMKTKIKQEKGITLIALVITIVVLLILAGVSINAIFSENGIINKAKDAQNKMDEAQQKDLNSINELNNWIDSKTNGATGGSTGGNTTGGGDNPSTPSGTWTQNKTTVTDGKTTYTVGDDYTYNCGVSGYTGGWKVLGADKGKLLIMSTVDVGTLQLSGKEGYNTGISQLNTICAPYGTEARSITVEDINRVTGYDPTKQNNNTKYGAGEFYEYGNKVTYTASGSSATNGKTYTSAISKYEHPDGRILGQNDVTSIQVESTAYYYYPSTLTTSDGEQTGEIGISKTIPAYKLLFRKADDTANCSYWLASSYVDALSNNSYFGLRIVYSGGYVYRYGLWSSYGLAGYPSLGVRAVVSL